MKPGRQAVGVALVWLSLSMPRASIAADPSPMPSPAAMDCGQMAVLLKEENTRLSDELRRIQREIAALRADLDKPGLPEVFAGIGYILGLFGVAAFVAARRRKE